MEKKLSEPEKKLFAEEVYKKLYEIQLLCAAGVLSLVLTLISFLFGFFVGSAFIIIASIVYAVWYRRTVSFAEYLEQKYNITPRRVIKLQK